MQVETDPRFPSETLCWKLYSYEIRKSHIKRLMFHLNLLVQPVNDEDQASPIRLGANDIHCYYIGQDCIIQVADLLRFQWKASTKTVHVEQLRAVNSVWLTDYFKRSITPLIAQAKGYEVLHASGVQTPAGNVIFCAEQMTGKSTLAYGLAKYFGYALTADDAVIIDMVSGNTIPSHFEIRLRDTARAYFETGGMFRPNYTHSTLPLAAIYMLEHNPYMATAEITTISPAKAFPVLLKHAYCFDLGHDARKKAMLEHYLDIAAHIPIKQVRFRPDFQHFPQLLQKIKASLT